MKIIFFILAVSLAVALAAPAPEAKADPQYYLDEVYAANPYAYDQFGDYADDVSADEYLRRRRWGGRRRGSGMWRPFGRGVGEGIGNGLINQIFG